MKNSQLLTTPDSLLGAIDRQRKFIVTMFNTPVPCPNQGCAKPLTVFEALGVDIDDYDFSHNPAPKYQCPHCGYKLRKVVPLVMLTRPGHHFEIDEPLPPKAP